MRCRLWVCVLLGLSGMVFAQENSPPANSPDQTGKSASQPVVPNLPPPRSDAVQAQDLGPAVGESSSKDAPVDLSAPKDDEKKHPQSSAAVANAEDESLSGGGVTELHTWDPHKAAKDIEVGDFYYKRKNYRAAEARYRDALLYKDDDAMATIRLASCLEKLGIFDDARAEYQSYLRILPHGPEARKAEKAIARLDAQAGK
ncbi:MAG: tetratricopeptide repeat protein [Candidatus Sulfotelmatobacter sp.]